MKKLDIGNREVIVFGLNYINILGQIRNFGIVGIRPILVWVKLYSQTPKESKYVKRYHEVGSVEDGLELILQLYGGNPLKNLISTDNDAIVERMDKDYSKLHNHFYLSSDFNGTLSLTNALYKENQCNVAKKYGLNPPAFEIVEVGQMPKTLRYPIFTKSVDSIDFKWKKKIKVCRDEKELKEFYKTLEDKSIMLQEFIPKQNELQIEGLSVNGGDEVYLAAQFLSYRNHENSYGTYKYGEEYNYGESLKRQIQDYLKEMHYSGIFEVEFLVDQKGVLYFLEFNFRYALFHHTMTQMGINLSAIWASSVVDGRLRENSDTVKTPFSVMYEFKDFQQSVLTGDLSFFRWITDFFKADSYNIINIKDPKPLFYYIGRGMKRLILRK